jgi:hypothetical protein
MIDKTTDLIFGIILIAIIMGLGTGLITLN